MNIFISLFVSWNLQFKSNSCSYFDQISFNFHYNFVLFQIFKSNYKLYYPLIFWSWIMSCLSYEAMSFDATIFKIIIRFVTRWHVAWTTRSAYPPTATRHGRLVTGITVNSVWAILLLNQRPQKSTRCLDWESRRLLAAPSSRLLWRETAKFTRGVKVGFIRFWIFFQRLITRHYHHHNHLFWKFQLSPTLS